MLQPTEYLDMTNNIFKENLLIDVTLFGNLIDDEFLAHDLKTKKKGLDIFNTKEHQFSIESLEKNQFNIRIPSSNNVDAYIILIDVCSYESKRKSEFFLSTECNCLAFQNYGECKHIIAALCYIEKLLKNYLMPIAKMQESKNIVPALPNSNVTIITANSMFNLENEIKNKFGKNYLSYQDEKKIIAFSKIDSTKTYTATIKQSAKINYLVSIVYDGESTMHCTCNCGVNITVPCSHTLLVLILASKSEKYHWKTLYNFTYEKAEIARLYNLEPNGKLAQQFGFSFSNYNDKVVVHPPKNLIISEEAIQQFTKPLAVQTTNHQLLSTSNLPQGIAIILGFNKPSDYSDFELIAVELKANKDAVLQPMVSKQITTQFLKQHQLASPEAINSIKELSISDIIQFAKENTSLPKIYEYGKPFYYYSMQNIEVLKKHTISILLKNWHHIAEHPHLYYRTLEAPLIQKVSFSTIPYTIQLQVLQSSETLEVYVEPVILLDDKKIAIASNNIKNGFLAFEDVLYPPSNITDYEIALQFNGESKLFLASFEPQVKRHIIYPFLKHHEVYINGAKMITNEINVTPTIRIIFKEAQENFLLVQPQFIYDTCIVDDNNTNALETVIDGDNIYTIIRNINVESETRKKLSELHPSFATQLLEPAFYLSYTDAMKDAWFVKAIVQLKQMGFDSYSTDLLKTFKINPHTPSWKMKTSSGIDWFDLQIEINFGDEEVALSEVRKALLAGQNMIKLKDGSIGLIPTEWREKFSTLLKMGNVQKNGELQISKLHFTIIDALHDEISEEKILQELAEKKNKLFNIEKVKTKAVSKNIKATLRHYQEHGLKWMQTLDELGWGGCLADDMGLGKTLQTIAFLQYIKEKYKTATSLVVCPTSLIYNWEAELQKFAPKLKYHIHYGGDRTFDAEAFAKFDIIIASYGMVRSDIELCKTIDWHYVILDESQAIKNPIAQITKAVQLLPAKNKLILSGTPLQNNTFDLYAQFQFINPGLLGNQDFFREEFSNPIDKNNDAEKSKLLRQLVYPFLLRRTKEQVATDLPAKIESTIWCEMDKKQRKVYNEYKDHYRQLVLDKIDEVGISKAGIYVIEGLLRLRQICDSPVLVKNPKVTTTDSVKIKELVRELQENTGTNKVLVFSQFTGMLTLLKEALDKEHISYSYLDGATKAEKRKEAVDNFQKDDSIKVFLISLKAGGVGLNLTAANYVYLIDPWWNPAVEQQAIDRTHRIGQKNKIFAYKMICKDTVEEKIVALQQRKKQLANDLITEDAGFLKKITREDVQFLFS